LLFRIKQNTNIIDFRIELIRFLSTFSKTINAREGRSGSLFTKSIKRKLVYDDAYMKKLIFYIHHNPVKHNVDNDFRNYPYSSYDKILNGNSPVFSGDMTLHWFNNDIDEFEDFHKYLHDENSIRNILLE
jgi:hypothetical protein